MPRSLTVQSEERLDRFLAKELAGYSRAQVKKLLAAGAVRVGGRVVKTGMRLAPGDVVTVQVEAELGEVPLGQPELPLAVVFESPGLVVVDKPAGQPTAPLRPDERGTLVNALVGRYPEMRGIGFGPLEPGILHRLDNQTSGLVMAARSREAFNAFAAQLERHEVEKLYLALVAGTPPDDGVLTSPIVNAGRAMRLGRGGEGQPARTSFRVLRRLRGHALLEVRITQGVRHQIRVHLASAGWPIAGDVLYGGAPGPAPRHFLHASRLGVPHPVSGEVTWLEAPLPPELAAWVNSIE